MFSPSKRGKFPNGLRMRIVFIIAGSGRLSVRCRTRASGPAIVGLSRRSFFGVSNSFSAAIRSRSLCVGTSVCAPCSSLGYIAKRVLPMTKAPFSFAAPRLVNRHVGRGMVRLGVIGKCSRG